MTAEEQPIRSIDPKDLLESVGKFRSLGYRFVQLCATKLDENSYEITYSFDKDYEFSNLRLKVSQETEIPSVTSIYRGAFLYENETRELFGINFTGINVDYGGYLYKKRIDHPFSVDSSREDES